MKIEDKEIRFGWCNTQAWIEDKYGDPLPDGKIRFITYEKKVVGHKKGKFILYRPSDPPGPWEFPIHERCNRIIIRVPNEYGYLAETSLYNIKLSKCKEGLTYSFIAMGGFNWRKI